MQVQISCPRLIPAWAATTFTWLLVAALRVPKDAVAVAVEGSSVTTTHLTGAGALLLMARRRQRHAVQRPRRPHCPRCTRPAAAVLGVLHAFPDERTTPRGVHMNALRLM